MVSSILHRNFLLLAAVSVMTFTAAGVPAMERLVPDGYPSVQSAIESADPGDTVIIRGGEYRENLVITRPLTVRGETASEVVVINAARTEEPVITVRGAADVEISGIAVSGSASAGIYVVDSSDVRIAGVSATGNRYGFHLERSDGNTIQDSSGELNEYGIYLVESNENRIEGSVADNNSDKGIILLNSSRNSLTGNSATANIWDGLNLYNSHRNSIRGNKLWKNTFPMVIISSDDNEFSDNSKMRRLYLIIPVLLIYFGIVIYFIEKRLFYLFLSGPKRQKSKQMGRFGGG